MNNFGFGCMRLPMKDGAVDTAEFTKMVDRFMAEGVGYFDTAHGYLDGQSELALRECLTSRYERSDYLLADKLSNNFFEKESDIRPLFESQLAACGVEYFDYYLMHCQNAEYYESFVSRGAYKTCLQLKAEGKIRRFGISFHDKADVLERILKEQPEIEVVQIQFNYADYDDPVIESRKCLDCCRAYEKDVIVMEPVKGGALARLTPDAARPFESLGVSPASVAIRFAASFAGVTLVLSGMSSLAEVEENVAFMRDFKRLTREELAAVNEAREIIKRQDAIHCTACHYCDGCPKNIPIPDFFACYNSKKQFDDMNSVWFYEDRAKAGAKASDCEKCGKCSKACPQHLDIPALLETVAAEFEK